MERRGWTAQEKLKAVAYSRVTSISEAARQFGCDRKRVREWRRQEEGLNHLKPNEKRIKGGGRKVYDANMEELLLDWITENRAGDQDVNRSMIVKKATDLVQERDPLSSFKASNGWLLRFLKQSHASPDVRKRRKSSESSSVASKTEQTSASTRKMAKLALSRRKLKRGKEESAVKGAEVVAKAQQSQKAVVATTDDDSGGDDELGSPARLVIDESEVESVKAEPAKPEADQSNGEAATSKNEVPTHNGHTVSLSSSATSSMLEIDPVAISAATKNVLPVSPQNADQNTDLAEGHDGGVTSSERVTIFVNSNCNLGPFISSRKMGKQPKTIGPSPPSSAAHEMLSLIVNISTTPVEVLKLIGMALADSKISGADNALKALATSSPSSNDVIRQTDVCSATDVWRLASQICERLQCCTNVFASVRLTKACGDCHRVPSGPRRSTQPVVPLGTGENVDNAPPVVNGGGLLIPSGQPNSKLQTPWTVVPPTSTNANSPASRVPASRSSPHRDFRSTHEQGKPSPTLSVNKRLLGASHLKMNGPTSRAASSTDSPPPMSMSLTHCSATSAVSDWTIEDVAEFVARNPDSSLAQHADMFRKHEIDGKALLLLSSDSILKYMGLKLGPSLKLGHLIDRLRVTSSSRSGSNAGHLK